VSPHSRNYARFTPNEINYSFSEGALREETKFQT
jgi:hypothetical protein